jgi:fatty-acyl-CoA synthase
VERTTLLDWFDDPVGSNGTLTVIGEETVPYALLHEQARALTGALVQAGAEPGRPVAFVASTTLGLLRALLATWHAGSPVMILPLPHRAADPEAFVGGCGEAMARAGAPLVVCDDQWQAALEHQLGPGAVVHHAALKANGTAPALRRPGPEDLAVLQPTSGTTAQPRIVAITHANLVSYIKAYPQRTGADPDDDVLLSWLPLAFDAGLSCIWVPAAHGLPTILAATERFTARPADWAAWLEEYGATQTVAPNFAYGVAARFGLAGHDLHRLRVAINGGEAINPSVFAAFAAAGAPAGSLCCAYGLAEATCAAAMAVAGAGL